MASPKQRMENKINQILNKIATIPDSYYFVSLTARDKNHITTTINKAVNKALTTTKETKSFRLTDE